MDKVTFERLQTLYNIKEKHEKNIDLCNDQLEAIYDICDHKYPNGGSALMKYNEIVTTWCEICERSTEWETK